MIGNLKESKQARNRTEKIGEISIQNLFFGIQKSILL
jgi:hypothetical protein